MDQLRSEVNSRAEAPRDEACEKYPFVREVGAKAVGDAASTFLLRVDTPPKKPVNTFEREMRQAMKEDPKGFWDFFHEDVRRQLAKRRAEEEYWDD